MKIRYIVALSMLAGAAFGATATQRIHAQAQPPAYVISEIDVLNEDAYAKEYLPPVTKVMLDHGVKYLARGNRTASIKGEPPKRVAVLTFDNFEKAQAAFNSPAFQEAARIGEKYANSESMQLRVHGSNPALRLGFQTFEKAHCSLAGNRRFGS